jgi:protein-disulfide isomerase
MWKSTFCMVGSSMNARSKAVFILLILWTLCAGAQAADASRLKPPAGARVAVVVFEDLQCPECARAYPVVTDAASMHKVPVVRHDFPLPRHNWSFQAAVWARYFESTSAALGHEFRKFIYANQGQISRDNLQQWVKRFGEANGTPLPPATDPEGKLAEKVRADFALGQRMGVEHTPTIWVVSNGDSSAPLVEEVKDREQLGQMIEDMLKKTPAARPAPGGSLKKGTAPKKGSARTTRKAG